MSNIPLSYLPDVPNIHHGSPSLRRSYQPHVHRKVHPSEIPLSQWLALASTIYLTSFVSGYDVSNVANIQPQIFKDIGGIEVLEWISLSYSLSMFASLSWARKATQCFNIRWMYLLHLLIFVSGTAIAGSAQTIALVVIGRSVMGIGGAVIQQLNTAYLTEFTSKAELPIVMALYSSCWAVGLAVGGPIGSAFADHTTWRWAFYINIPLLVVCLALGFKFLPSYRYMIEGSYMTEGSYMIEDISLLKKVQQLDLVGVILNAVVPYLFAISITFPPPVWAWDSIASYTTVVLFLFYTVVWILQQSLCIFTTPSSRALPLHMISQYKTFIPIWIASACSGSLYAIPLTYLPLYFAFTTQSNALDLAVKQLPFTLVFITTLLITGRLIRVIKIYKIFYVISGLISLVASILMATQLRTQLPITTILAIESLLGLSLGLCFQHAIAICGNALVDRKSDRIDNLAICNIALFGGIGITLSIAGSVFQNTGYHRLLNIIGNTGASAEQIREALTGISSGSIPKQSRDAAVAIIKIVIADEFFISVATSSLALLCGLAMKADGL